MTMGANDVYSAHEDESAHNDHGMVPIMPMIEVPTKKQWHVWHVAHSQLCLKNKSTHEIPNKKTIQYLSIIYKWGLRTN